MGDTGSVTARLTEVWRELEPQLMRLLAARGVRRADAEDMVQDVAVKVIERSLAFTCASDLYAWTATALRNAHRNAVRDQRRRRSDEHLPELVSEQDVASDAIARLELDRVLKQLGRLSPDDQEALLSAIEEPPGPVAGRLRVRRHRARGRLRRALGEDGPWV